MALARAGWASAATVSDQVWTSRHGSPSSLFDLAVTEPSEALFEALTREDFGTLLQAMLSGLMHESDLALAVEVVTRDVDAIRAVSVFEYFIEHTSPIVREACFFALQARADVPLDLVPLVRLHATAQGEPSPAVRTAAAEVLDSLEP